MPNTPVCPSFRSASTTLVMTEGTLGAKLMWALVATLSSFVVASYYDTVCSHRAYADELTLTRAFHVTIAAVS